MSFLYSAPVRSLYAPAVGAALLALTATGCSGHGDVSGKVTYKGKALVWGTGSTWQWSTQRTASASTPSRPAPSTRRFTGGTPKEVMESLSPMSRPSTVKDIADAILFLTDAATVTAHILYVDGGAHFGRW